MLDFHYNWISKQKSDLERDEVLGRMLKVRPKETRELKGGRKKSQKSNSQRKSPANRAGLILTAYVFAASEENVLRGA
jgi:hypothetical protein